MNVTCPDCRSIFRVDPAKVPLGGVRARCSVCGGVIPVSAPEFVTAVEAAATAPVMTSFAIESAGFPPEFEAMPESVAMEEADSIVAPPRAPFVPPRPPFAPARAPFASPSAPFTPSRAPSTTPPRTSFAPARPAVPPASPLQPPRPWGSMPHAAQPAPPITRVRPTPLGSAPLAPQGTPPRAAAAPPVVSPIGSPRPQPLVVTPAVTPLTPHPGVPSVATPTPAVQVTGGPPRRTPNPYLANDPSQKAKRLARALVSDMVAYLPQRREEGLKNHTLKLLFREEIKKSYEEYVDQVGKEFAESTTHFQDALNDLLAAGKKIF